MRNYEEEIKARVEFIRKKMEEAHADGLVFGNSGGKDSALVGILCSMATKNLLAVAMPCNSKRNYGFGRRHRFGAELRHRYDYR